MLLMWHFLVQTKVCHLDNAKFRVAIGIRNQHTVVAVKHLHLHPHLFLRLFHPKCLTLGYFGKLLWLLCLGQLSELQL